MELRSLTEWSNEIKVHRLLCLDLKEFVDRISLLFSALESARPRCKPGVQALCSLQIAMDKANLLLSSTVLPPLNSTWCERIRNALALSMNQVRNFVPPSLAAKISGILNQLISRKFHLETSEHEAGIALLSLLKHGIPAFSNSIQWELGRLQLAALRLNITSPAALLMERGAIRRLLGKFHQAHPRKEKILCYLFHLLNKHGNFILGRQSERVDSQREMEMQVKCDGIETAFANRSISEPPEEFKCPISGRLFYDPVVIASGETFERAWIEYWFNNGKLTCPVTCRRLNHFALTSNVAMKSIITRWCSSHGINIPELPQELAPAVFETKASSSSSITSFGGYVDDLQLQLSNLSLHSSDSDSSLVPPDGQSKDHPACQLPEVNTNCQNQLCHSLVTRSREGNCGITLSKLTDLSWGSQCEIVARFRQLVEENDKSWQSTFSESSLLVLIRFLKCANELCNVEVQKDGAEVLLAILSLSRTKLPPCEEDVIYMLASMLDSELALQALALLDILSRRSYYGSKIVASGILPCILKMFDDRRKESRKLAIKILCNLSENGDHIGHHIVYLDIVQKLTSLLADPELAGYGIQLVKRLCEIEAVRSTVATTVAENKSFTGSIAWLLECGTPESQEHALDVLMALCREQTRFRWLILKDRSIVQYLGNISEDGKCSRGQAIALELLSLQHQIKAGVGIDPSSPDKKGPRSQPASEELYQRALRWIRKRA